MRGRTQRSQSAQRIALCGLRGLCVQGLLLALPSSAFATWSVIAIDRSTSRVVIASATCVDRDDQFLMGVQAVVVPGKGVAACQAGVDNTHQNQMLVFQELQKGTECDQPAGTCPDRAAAAGRHAADQRHRSQLSRPRRGRGGAAAPLRVRAVRVGRDARLAGRWRLTTPDSCGRARRDEWPRPRQGRLCWIVQAARLSSISF